jgi:hypothetical protein
MAVGDFIARTIVGASYQDGAVEEVSFEGEHASATSARAPLADEVRPTGATRFCRFCQPPKYMLFSLFSDAEGFGFSNKI